MNKLLAAADKIKTIWAAGIVDGEGCIYIARDGERRTYTLMVRVCMSHESTIRRLKNLFNVGSLYSYKPKKKNRKTMWNWACAGKDAQSVLSSLLPYLWTKRPQAQIGVSFQNYKRTIRRGFLRSSVEMRKQHNFYVALQDQK